MEQLHDILEYSQAHRIAICKIHYYAILRSQLRSHLDSKHKEVTAKTRQKIVLAAAVYCQWATTEDQVVFPNFESQPILHLPVYQDGLMCTGTTPSNQACGYIRRTVQDIQKHCREEHRWVNKKKRGRPGQGQQPQAQSMWITGVVCQKFQPSGTLGRLFAVSQSEPSTYTVDPEDRDIQGAITLSLTQATASIELTEKEQQNRIKADQDRFQFNAWLDRAGWAKHLKGFDRSWLLTTVAKLKPKERALDRVCCALQLVIYKAQQSARPIPNG
jgi:K+-sensing histidine kinase KdpD